MKSTFQTNVRITSSDRSFLMRCAAQWLMLCVGWLLCTCSQAEPDPHELQDIASYTRTAPDSALRMLQRMDVGALSRSSAAYHTLLLIEASFHANREVEGDTLIQSAWQYFSSQPDEVDKQIRTLFYWGYVKLQQKDSGEALRLFFAAEELLRQHPDARYQGLLYWHIGDIYYNESDFRQAAFYAKESLRFFRQVSDVPGEAWALVRLGDIAGKMTQLNQAIRHYTDAFHLAHDIPDETIVHECLKNLVQLYFIVDQAVPASIMQHIEEFAAQSGNHVRLDFHLLRHDSDSARYYLRRMEAQIDDATDRIAYHHAGYWVELFSDDPQAATVHLHRFLHLKDSVSRRSSQLSAGEIRRGYFEERLRFADYRMRNRTLLMSAGIFVLLLIGISLLYHQRQKLRIHQLRNQNYLQTVKEAEEAYEALARQVNRNEARLVKDLSTRFSVIERIGRTYYEQENTARQKEAIYQEVKHIIDDISNDQGIRRELEQIVDHSRQNAMQRLRQAYPAMKDSDLRLLCYTFCGFSPQIISLFTGETVENVYARKSRLKSRIKASDSPDRDFFLQLF